jgi:CPA2 family monovalent cation:H+ antiporter-2
MLGLEYVVDDVVASLRSSYVAGPVDAALNFTPGLVVGLAMGWEWLPAVSREASTSHRRASSAKVLG